MYPEAMSFSPNKEAAVRDADPQDAADQLAAGKRVELTSVAEVTQFIRDLGNEHALLDLGRVTVNGTDLFTVDSLGIERSKMPQLAGRALPGSLAAKMGKRGNEGPDDVDVSDLFYKSLAAKGVRMVEENIPAVQLKPTQRDINGNGVAVLMGKFITGEAQERRIPISQDGFIVDGHHEWAATIGEDYADGHDAGLTIPVTRIDQPIKTILAEANAFAQEYGIPQAGLAAA